MSTKTQLMLAETRKGRVILHLVGLSTDHKVKLHCRGIWRELSLQGVGRLSTH